MTGPLLVIADGGGAAAVNAVNAVQKSNEISIPTHYYITNHDVREEFLQKFHWQHLRNPLPVPRRQANFFLWERMTL